MYRCCRGNPDRRKCCTNRQWEHGCLTNTFPGWSTTHPLGVLPSSIIPHLAVGGTWTGPRKIQHWDHLPDDRQNLERGERNRSVLHIFPSKLCKINTSPCDVHVLVCVCFHNNMLLIAVALRARVVTAGSLGLDKRVGQWQKYPLLFPWQCYPVPPTPSQFLTGLCFFGTICHY